MGAWSHESLGNDDACDWVAELAESTDLSAIEAAFDAVLQTGEDYLEAPDASIAIAAAEAVARLQGNWGKVDPYSESLDTWAKRMKLVPPTALAAKARQALDRVLAEQSELRELWEESEEGQQWVASVSELKQRVRV